jgi:sugar lactone lactonase YvrE
VDASGNLYVADTYNYLIRKITSAGVVTTFAGTALMSGSTDGTGSAASFNSPLGIAVDASGNLYVTDFNTSKIRKITPESVVTTLAGGAGVYADGTGMEARFNSPQGITSDASGNLYVADTNNSMIRMVTPEGVVTTLAGTAGTAGHADGTGLAAGFYYPEGITADANGNLYVADTYNCIIRKITPEGVVSTLAGTAEASGSTDGTGSAARFGKPEGIAVDTSGNLYVADTYNDTIRKITPEGVVTTLAGTTRTSGSTDGTGSAARFDEPEGIAVDASSNLYVADKSNGTIRKITPEGVVTTLAGNPREAGWVDGTGSEARFYYPEGIAVDASGNLYVVDTGLEEIRRITPKGVVTTIVGAYGNPNPTTSTGPLPASLYMPQGVTVDATGNLFITVPNAVLTLEP